MLASCSVTLFLYFADLKFLSVSMYSKVSSLSWVDGVCCVCVEGEQPDVSRIFQVNSQTLTSVCQTNVYMTPTPVTPHVSSDAMDSQVPAAHHWLINWLIDSFIHWFIYIFIYLFAIVTIIAVNFLWPKWIMFRSIRDGKCQICSVFAVTIIAMRTREIQVWCVKVKCCFCFQ